MKKFRTFLMLSAFLIVATFPAFAFASDITVSADSAQVLVGQTVTVTVTVEASNMSVAQGTFEYDYGILSYASGTGGVADGQLDMVSMQSGGTSSLTAVIEFTAISEGNASVSVTLDNILDYDGNALDAVSGSVVIPVVASSARANDGTEVIPPFTLDGIAASNVYGTETPLYVWRSVMNLTLPSGFADTNIIYSGETIGGAVSMENSNTVLLYLSDESGENADFYVYDEASHALHPYVSVKSASQNFTFLWPDASIAVPDGYTTTTIELDDMQIPAWTLSDSDGFAYLVYVIDDSGEKAIYQYIPQDESFQRYIAPTAVQIASSGKAIDANVFLALCIVCGLLFVSVVALLILYFSEQKEKREIIAFSKKRISELQDDKEY